ncbi:type I 3-dehydroquinate dehydratase [Staphylococcus agnetis]|uniref:type I 3-dehydroquinate dehydratase n=2 Tax=Staphylococcus agnetis TaxID=985762 RepID=UPI00208E4AAE|nr:type I 3-dehydroquinate dehydratase [Staphylococcus agnetis]MCO4338830.1 type I 3-dehydroquinate dehydratase [Staphylococcus agnetis]
MITQIVGSFMPKTIECLKDDIARIKTHEDDFDILEIRIDAIKNVTAQHIECILRQLKEASIHCEKLITFRTEQQGGESGITEEAYWSLMRELADMKDVTYIDIEWDRTLNRKQLVNELQSKGIQVVISYHNFEETPQLEVLKKTYYYMSQWGGTHLKIAVMPHTKNDVITLLQVVSEASDALQQWVTGISMSKLGVASRIAQQTFGGALTYGSIQEGVAPGQLNVKTLKSAMALYQ